MGITITNSGQGSVVRFRNLGRGGLMTSTKNPPFLLLNYYPGAYAAYSLRKLDYAYTGSAIRVRRSSDNAEQNIGFVNNVLDTASLLTFCGAGNGFVTTFYDQSGNARNQIQTVNNNQPSIVTSGSILLDNGKPCISQDGVSGRMLERIQSFPISSLSVFQVFKINDTTFQTNFGGGSSYVLFGYTASFPADSLTVSSRFKNGVSLVTNDAPQVTTNYGNNTQILSSAFYTGAVTWNGFGWGNSTSWPTTGNVQEHIWYASSQASNRTGIETNINSYYSIYASNDSDAQAFFDRVTTAGGILSATEQTAVNQLVISMKAAGIWTKMRVIYPMVGASSAACSQNLKSSSFVATFTDCTFSTNGVTYGGSAQVLVPLNLNTMNSINDISFGYYCRSDIQSLGSFGWGFPSALSPPVEFWIEYTNGSKYGYLFDSGNDGGIAGDSKGLNSMSRIASTTKYIQKNGTIDTYTSTSSGTLPSRDFYFGKGSQGTEFGRENAFGFVGDGLTSTNLSDLYTAVQAFQTTLGRQV